MPRPAAVELPAELRVTWFRQYLRCPWRFRLERLGERLALPVDTGDELEPAAFGGLAHRVLAAFGGSSAAGSTDPDEIAAFLSDELRRQAADWFGGAHLPSVDLQLAQLQRRLERFARWQARETAAGWLIQPRLCEIEARAPFDVDANGGGGTPIGRILAELTGGGKLNPLSVS